MKILIVKLQVKPEFRDQFIEVSLIDARGSTETEPGCARFDFLQDEKDPNTFYFYEVYLDDAAFTAHTQTEHFAAYRTIIKPEWHAAPTEVVRCVNLYPASESWK
jgi:quinol monooxygenase YgiN